MPKKLIVESHSLGRRGENIVCHFLLSRGFVVLGRNIRPSAGSGVRGEIDIVCMSQNRVHLVEVKSRSSADFGDPVASVSLAQAVRIGRVWRSVCTLHNDFTEYKGLKTQVDIAAIVLIPGQKPQLTLYWNVGLQDLL